MSELRERMARAIYMTRQKCDGAGRELSFEELNDRAQAYELESADAALEEMAKEKKPIEPCPQCGHGMSDTECPRGHNRYWKTNYGNCMACQRDDAIEAFNEAFEKLAAAETKIERLQEFKDYVHTRLNCAGIPADPESPHKAAGCRIGGRLDLVLGSLMAAKELRDGLERTLDSADVGDDIFNAVRLHCAKFDAAGKQ